jgi:hypothetical protein
VPAYGFRNPGYLAIAADVADQFCVYIMASVKNSMFRQYGCPTRTRLLARATTISTMLKAGIGIQSSVFGMYSGRWSVTQRQGMCHDLTCECVLDLIIDLGKQDRQIPCQIALDRVHLDRIIQDMVRCEMSLVCKLVYEASLVSPDRHESEVREAHLADSIERGQSIVRARCQLAHECLPGNDDYQNSYFFVPRLRI